MMDLSAGAGFLLDDEALLHLCGRPRARLRRRTNFRRLGHGPS